MNYTFSSELAAGQLEQWLAAVPPGFRFSFKAPQRITHFQRLLSSEETLKAFLTSLSPARRAGKLGAILFQLPPNFKPDHARLKNFLALRSLRPFSIAFEFRHAGWFSEETYSLLRQKKVALCIAESEDIVTPSIHTSPHTYFRLRCPGGYSSQKLTEFSQTFLALSREREVYAYFKHEEEPTGVLNALAMLRCANEKLTEASAHA